MDLETRELINAIRGEVAALRDYLDIVNAKLIFNGQPGGLVNGLQLQGIVNGLQLQINAMRDQWMLGNKPDPYENLDVMYKRPFDMIKTGRDSFTLRGVGADVAYPVILANAQIGTYWFALEGLAADGDDYAKGSITADTAVWVELNRATQEVTIVADTAWPSTTSAGKYDYTIVHPLWWVPWSSGNSKIDWRNALDMRGGVYHAAVA